MPKPLIVIKLGGSALTDKFRIYTPRFPVIARAAEQVAAIAKRFSIVLVHGAGSYGHIPVRRFGLAHGFTDPKQLRSLAATKLKLLEWQQILDAVFLKHSVPMVSLVASDFVVAKGGRIASAELEPLGHWLGIGCVPTTGGDIVPDSETGFSILSGDQLATYMAIRLGASKVIFAMDVDGIFDSDPKRNRKAKLLTDLTPSQASRLAGTLAASTAPDVTGGMAGKINEAVEVASKGISVDFVNLTKDERLKKAAFGDRVLCSRIRLG
jgi:isopentenyl phosphate kinase